MFPKTILDIKKVRKFKNIFRLRKETFLRILKLEKKLKTIVFNQRVIDLPGKRVEDNE